MVGASSPVPPFLRGHPAAAEVETLWGFTGQLRAQGVQAAASWPPPQLLSERASPTPLHPPNQRRVRDEHPNDHPDSLDVRQLASRRRRRGRDELTYALVGATAVLGDDGVGVIRRGLLYVLGTPCALTPLVWWGASANTMPGDEIALIFLACVCVAATVHDGLLTIALGFATCGRRDDALAAAAEAAAVDLAADEAEAAVDEAEDVEEEERAARATDEAMLESRFVQRHADLRLEERLKSASKRKVDATAVPSPLRREELFAV